MRKKKNQPQKRKRERTARKTEEKESSSSYLCFSFIYRARAAVFPRLVKERSNVKLFCRACRNKKQQKANKKQPLFFAKNALVLCPYLPRLRINVAENARKDTYRYECSVCSFSVLVSSRWRSDARIERSKSCCFFGVFSSSIFLKAGFKKKLRKGLTAEKRAERDTHATFFSSLIKLEQHARVYIYIYIYIYTSHTQV